MYRYRYVHALSLTAQTAALFFNARVVVGVHGGALSNIIWSAPPCKDGENGADDDKTCGHTRLVLELGFPAPQTRHYAHAAASLDLHYEVALLEPDERGPGAATVSLNEATLEQIAALVQQNL